MTASAGPAENRSLATARERIRFRAFRAMLRAGQLAAMPTARWRPLPDFLIIGGQRCGTTSLYRYLDEHPAVLFPRLTKGTHWLDEQSQRTEAWYRSNFPLATSRRRASARAGVPAVVGEACPYYVFHPAVPARIRAALPSVRTIAVLRDPVERAWSGYHHELRRGFETLPFEAALDAEPERLAGAEALLEARGTVHFSHQHHGHVARGRYAEQLERLWRHTDRDRTLVLYTDDLERDPAGTMQRVHSFIGVPDRPVVGARHWNQQSRSPMADRVRRRLQETFTASDEWLAATLEEPLPWRR